MMMTNNKARLIFFGTPDFAVPSLATLFNSPHDVVQVVTAPDRPSGRGRRLRPSPVKRFAQEHELPLAQPVDLSDKSFLNDIRALSPDIMVVVAFRILPEELYTIPVSGTFNLHASLLPKYRGAAPIHWALMNGETETGVSTFFLKRRVDTGNLILQNTVGIDPEDNLGSLHDKLAHAGAPTVLKTIEQILTGSVEQMIQDNTQATRAPKITAQDRILDFTEHATNCNNRVRAFAPRPGAITYREGQVLKILQSRVLEQEGSPGVVLDVSEKGILVGCGGAALLMQRVQPEGKRSMQAADYLRGQAMEPGDQFG